MGRTQATNLKKGRKYEGFVEVARENTDFKRLFHRSQSEIEASGMDRCLVLCSQTIHNIEEKQDECFELERFGAAFRLRSEARAPAGGGYVLGFRARERHPIFRDRTFRLQ